MYDIKLIFKKRWIESLLYPESTKCVRTFIFKLKFTNCYSSIVWTFQERYFMVSNKFTDFRLSVWGKKGHTRGWSEMTSLPKCLLSCCVPVNSNFLIFHSLRNYWFRASDSKTNFLARWNTTISTVCKLNMCIDIIIGNFSFVL
jgi:hypothetical protein